MITFAWAAISRIAVYISSARDQTMAKPVPPPVVGCQSGETDHGLSGSSSRRWSGAHQVSSQPGSLHWTCAIVQR
jgi:hypothetical protein